jgi:uncharacterized protein (DUF362 family)
MERRKFIQHSLIATGGMLCLPGFAAVQKAQLAIVRGGSAANMLDLGLEALGDLSRFIEPGQRILVKPTIRWNQAPESGQNTNPDLLERLVERCYEAGARGVFLVDQTQDNWTKCYKNSGIERVVKDAGAKILPGDKEFLYHEIDIPNAQVMKRPKVHEVMQEVDLIINVPAVQPQTPAGYFGAFHNLMGLVWQPESYQQQATQSMLDFLHYKTPVLNIMDAYRVVTSTGVKEYKTLVLSPDIVAAEVYAAKRLGTDPGSLSYLEQAEQAGFGKMELRKEHIRSIVLKNSVQ